MDDERNPLSPGDGVLVTRVAPVEGAGRRVDRPVPVVRPRAATSALAILVSVVVLLVAPASASAQLNPDLDLLPDDTTATTAGDGDRGDGDRRGGEGGRTSVPAETDRTTSPGSATLPGPPASSGGGSSTGALAGGLVAGALLGAVGGFLLARRSKAEGGDPLPVVPPPVHQQAAPAAAVDESVRQAYEAQVAAHAGQAQQAAAERGALVAALLDVIDTSTSDAVRTQVAERLAGVAVLPFEVPVGSPFDPAVHRGVQSVAAPSVDHHSLVAGTDRPGWADRGAVLRQPEVIVYRWDKR